MSRRPKLTPEQQQLKKIFNDKLEEIENEISAAQQKKTSLIHSCNHCFPEIDRKRDSDFRTEQLSYNAYCLICNSRFGHLCLESPDKVCHYYSKNGQVELVDKTFAQVPPGHDAKFETDDCCIFCGWPEERK